MTDAQATVIAAMLTVAAAVLGVALGARLFGGRVRSLEDALAQTKDRIESHLREVDTVLSEMRDSLETTIKVLNQSRAEISELSERRRPEGEAVQEHGEAPEADDEWASWYAMRDDWNKIRDEIERRAADSTVDGRTRAKYGRVDRRKYWALIKSMDDDGTLGSQADDFRDAYRLWQQFRAGRSIPDRVVAVRMRTLREKLAGESEQ